LFDRFFGRRSGGPPRGANIEVELEIPLERVRTGGQEEVRFARVEPCAPCKGNGARGGAAAHVCPACKGSGQRTQTDRKSKSHIIIQQISTCPDCRGAGRIVDEICPECQGRGRVERDERLKVNIPAGIEEGMALRIPGHGVAASDARGTSGDLFVIVRSAPDTRFERSGAHLWHEEVIALTDAVLGTNLNVPTLERGVELKVPPGTQPGSVLHIRGYGLPEFGGRGRGDLHVRLNVRTPQKLSAEEQTLYQRLRALERAAASTSLT
jgi:molecular chaperone DnaJ